MATRVNKSQSQNSKSGNYGSKMAARNVEIRAVGAWVQPEIQGDPHLYDAVLSAQEEEARILKQQKEKEAKLQHFQDEVRKRVRQLQHIKQQQQMQKSRSAVETERKVVYQSAFSSGKSTPRKNRCSVRPNSALSISSQHSSIHGSVSSRSELDSAAEHSFENHTSKVHAYSRHARQKLTSKQVVAEKHERDEMEDDLWKRMDRHEPSSPDCNRETLSPCEEDINELNVRVERNASLQDDPDSCYEAIHSADSSVRFVQFESDQGGKEESRKDRISRKSTACLLGSQVNRVPQVPVLYPGVISEEEKIRAQSQLVMYRRLFMDLEREQVKENIRRRNHRKKIKLLKKAAEAEREKLEQVAQEMNETNDYDIQETSEAAEMERKITEEEEKLQESLQEERQRKEKGRETERFLEALKQNLREKIQKKKNVELPPLCCCADSVWDTNPETCANNCVFYKNPKGYARALQSLLASCDVV